MTPLEKLTDENFVLYASRCYTNTRCIDEQEFLSDVQRIKYVKRILRKYAATGEIQERLTLNHIIVIANMFTVSGAKHMLFHRMEPELHSALKTFLVFLNYLTAQEWTHVALDSKLVHSLRNL